ncbi:MAG: type II CRISPR-associated endonuclease Cas1 [Bacteroidales bacterium]|nr:type II CRISPR-associated endonuclease Cas1 [Bacteroidales bacterium]
MIKKTLCFTNPAYLSLKDRQLLIQLKEVTDEDDAEVSKKIMETSRPIEDIGVVVLAHRQITITSGAMSALLDNNCAIITCDNRSMPTGLLLPLSGNSVQSERFQEQINASLPLRKQLWQQTVQFKIRNQAAILKRNTTAEIGCMIEWANGVRSGDPDNIEGRAAHYYWQNLFGHIDDFARDRDGIEPNALLNYGYAILRAVVARALVSSGMLPTLGIHHHNRYNAYCLADDIMEPYRPYIDQLVFDIVEQQGLTNELTKEIKAKLLTIPTLDVVIEGKRSPLMVGVSQTTASLYRCFSGEIRKIAYPEL